MSHPIINDKTGTCAASSAFDFLVFIGRFQPFHQGHQTVIRSALTKAPQVIILCGSAHQPRSLRNPWTFAERETMIRSTLSISENQRVHIAPLMDVLYNDESWVRNVQATVKGLVTAHHATPHKSACIGLIGHNKDHSAYYLKLFPQWGAVEVPNVKNISATSIREQLFNCNQQPDTQTALTDSSEDKHNHYLSSPCARAQLPPTVHDYLKDFSQSAFFTELNAEQAFVTRYQKAWANAPYAPTFVTVDAVVVQSGHVLMVERRARPGKGLLALPGGFINPNETLEHGCIRELREETKLKIPEPVLKGSIKASRIFDDPHRSARGRTITVAFYIELAPNENLPKVRGSSDARNAFWLPLAELTPTNLFEDHYFIIQTLTGM